MLLRRFRLLKIKRKKTLGKNNSYDEVEPSNIETFACGIINKISKIECHYGLHQLCFFLLIVYKNCLLASLVASSFDLVINIAYRTSSMQFVINNSDHALLLFFFISFIVMRFPIGDSVPCNTGLQCFPIASTFPIVSAYLSISLVLPPTNSMLL